VGDRGRPKPKGKFQTGRFQLVTGRVWKGTQSAVRRGRTDVPKTSTPVHERPRSRSIRNLITHVLKSGEEINKASI